MDPQATCSSLETDRIPTNDSSPSSSIYFIQAFVCSTGLTQSRFFIDIFITDTKPTPTECKKKKETLIYFLLFFVNGEFYTLHGFENESDLRRQLGKSLSHMMEVDPVKNRSPPSISSSVSLPDRY